MAQALLDPVGHFWLQLRQGTVVVVSVLRWLRSGHGVDGVDGVGGFCHQLPLPSQMTDLSWCCCRLLLPSSGSFTAGWQLQWQMMTIEGHTTGRDGTWEAA